MPDEIQVLESPALPVLQRPLSQSPAAVYLARLSSGSRPTQLRALQVICRIPDAGANPATFPWHRLDYSHTAFIRSQLAGEYAPATANRMLAALRGVLREAWRLGEMDIEQCERACDLAPIRGSRQPKGRMLVPEEMRRLLAVCPSTPAGLRDAALIAVLYSGGLRRAEVVGLNVTDYNAEEGTLTVIGKGNKERSLFLVDWALDRLAVYLPLRGDAGPIFVRVRKGAGGLTDSRLTPQAVRYIVRERCREAGVPEISPHDFRRSMISALLDAGIDLATVKDMAGHANVQTTARYDRRGRNRMRVAAQRLQL